MRIVLVGSPLRRRHLRGQLPDDFEVVAEVTTMAEARLVSGADGYVVTPAYSTADDERLMEPLTTREREVLAALVDGLPNKAIAARLGISDETVKFHLSAIFGKLGASNRTDAVRRALRRGLVEL